MNATHDRQECLSHHRRAFTLLELLLATALGAMMALTLFTAFNTAIKARRTAQQTLQLTRAGSIALDLVCRDFESVVPPASSEITNYFPLSGPFQGTHRGGSTGDADGVAFHAIDRAPTANSINEVHDPLAEGICKIEYYVDSSVTPPALVRRVTRNLLATVQTDPEPELICRGVRSFTLQYYDGSIWSTDWDSTQVGDVLPLAVQIVLDVDDPNSPPLRAGAPGVRRMSRTIPLACAKLPPTEEVAQ